MDPSDSSAPNGNGTRLDARSGAVVKDRLHHLGADKRNTSRAPGYIAAAEATPVASENAERVRNLGLIPMAAHVFSADR